MTCKEKLIKDHPEWDKRDIMMTLLDRCPMEFMVIGMPDYCHYYVSQDACETCWDRELYNDDEVETEEDKIMEAVVEDLKTPVIKDSGNRTEFSTGAVRDMREGKGRCDLMPLKVVAEYFRLGKYAPDPQRSEDYWIILTNISNFKVTNYIHTGFLYTAMDVFITRVYDYTPTAFLEVAKHFEEGAKKYGEGNWERGIPPKFYIDSAVRHFLKWVRGDNDEPHDRAFIWNLMCCIWEVDYHKEDSNV